MQRTCYKEVIFIVKRDMNERLIEGKGIQQLQRRNVAQVSMAKW